MKLKSSLINFQRKAFDYPKKIKKSMLVLSLLSIAGTVTAETKMLMDPAISESKIAFVYAGDIWVSGRDGSNPHQLTSSNANEKAPHFSPDGKWIAYTADHDGNEDVYLISSSGGQPKRLTWHPEKDIVNAWSADGQRVLFTSRREMRQGRSAQAWEVSMTGGLPVKIMDAVVQSSSWSEDGSLLAYQPYNTGHRGASGWRNHRGGSTPPIWIMAPQGNTFEAIPHVRASDTNPLWVGDKVYFLSDRDKVRNLYQYDRQSKAVTKVTHENQWDILSADTNGKEIIYNAGGVLKRFSPQSGKVSKLTISINPDLPERRVKWKSAMSALESAAISTTGQRVLISARGEVFTVPVDKGSTRNLTQTDGIRERDALWSPKGDQIAYTTDITGEQRLMIRHQDFATDSKQSPLSFDLGDPADYSLLLWAGDGSKIIYQDNHLGLWSINITTGKRSKIDTDNRRSEINLALSNDGRYLAYTKVGANYLADIYIYDFQQSTSHKLTDGMSDAGNPNFSRDGQYLYFTASTNAGTTAVGLDMSSQERPKRSAIYALVLSADGKSPLWAKSDEEKVTQEDKKSDKKKDKKEKPSTKIDLANIASRIVALPVAQKAYHNLRVAEDNNLYYIESSQPGVSIGSDGSPEQTGKLIRFDFKERKTEMLQEDVESFDLSSDGKKLLLITSEQAIKTAKIDTKLEPEDLDTQDVKLKIDPIKEWAQIFDEAWRTEQQYFYDPNMHGLDWQAVKEQFSTLLPHVGRRSDLNVLLVEMIAQMEVGHNRVTGGDIPQPEKVPVGLLGADLRVKDQQYIIEKIYTGEQWNPSLKAPLAIPGLGVKTGDVILQVNGQAVDASINIFSLLENTVGKQLTLTVSTSGKAKDARHITVEPIASEGQLRLWNWIEDNRRTVDEASGGEIGYVYLPDTYYDGFTYFNRLFFAQVDKKAMIIDERRNSGGQAANYITDILSRQYLASWKDRDGMIFDTPGGAVYGPKVMLIDQDAGSGGDFLPYSFKRLGLGKLIGKRTWGGLIGIYANRTTIDGGTVIVPFFRFFTPENEWRVENEGVAPDLDVELNPTLVNQGRDSQLEAGISEVLKQLKTYQPIKLKSAPPFPTELGK